MDYSFVRDSSTRWKNSGGVYLVGFFIEVGGIGA